VRYLITPRYFTANWEGAGKQWLDYGGIGKYDKIVCGGDSVGYGAGTPRFRVHRVGLEGMLPKRGVSVRGGGNHDKSLADAAWRHARVVQAD